MIALDTDNNVVAGVCALVFHPQEKIWEMSKLSVSPEYRRNGIAERLVDAIIETAKSKGVRKLFLDTSKNSKPQSACITKRIYRNSLEELALPKNRLANG